MTTTESQPAGWYPAPEDKNTEAFWDGTVWTAKRRMPERVTAERVPERPRNRYERRLAVTQIVFWCVGVLCLVVGIAQVNDYGSMAGLWLGFGGAFSSAAFSLLLFYLLARAIGEHIDNK